MERGRIQGLPKFFGYSLLSQQVEIVQRACLSSITWPVSTSCVISCVLLFYAFVVLIKY